MLVQKIDSSLVTHGKRVLVLQTKALISTSISFDFVPGFTGTRQSHVCNVWFHVYLSLVPPFPTGGGTFSSSSSSSGLVDLVVSWWGVERKMVRINF